MPIVQLRHWAAGALLSCAGTKALRLRSDTGTGWMIALSWPRRNTASVHARGHVIGRMVNAEGGAGSVQVYDHPHPTSHPAFCQPIPLDLTRFPSLNGCVCLARYAFAAVSDTSGTKRKSAFSIAGCQGWCQSVAPGISREPLFPPALLRERHYSNTGQCAGSAVRLQLSLMLNNLS
jgi:hypothetical protein